MPAVDKQGPAQGEEMNQALAAVLRFMRRVDRRHCFALLSRRLPAGLDVSAAFNVDAEGCSSGICVLADMPQLYGLAACHRIPEVSAVPDLFPCGLRARQIQ